MMSSDTTHNQSTPSQTEVEESYWHSLLSEGEHAPTTYEDDESIEETLVNNFLSNNASDATIDHLSEYNEYDADWDTIHTIMDNDG
ncbi:MAG: hypothetical protein ACFE0Q_14750, partial [Anaerolineae bacterium]